MNQSLLQQLKDANRKYLAGTLQSLDSAGDPFVVIACMDARLTCLLEPALGLPKGRAIVIRTAGNVLSHDSHDALRSVAAAIFIKGGKEIFIAGHTDCALSKFSAAEIIENFRAAGISRSAFGDEDLRSWFGAFVDIKANVLQGAEYLRKSGLVPAAVKIHGLVIRIETGEAEVVLNGDEATTHAAPITPPEKEERAAERAPTAPEAVPPGRVVSPAPPAAAVARGPIVIAPAERVSKQADQPDSVLSAVMIVRDFIVHERQNSRFGHTIARIETMAKQERDPVRIVAELEAIAKDYRAKYPELPWAIEYLKKTVQEKGYSRLGLKEFMKLLAGS